VFANEHKTSFEIQSSVALKNRLHNPIHVITATSWRSIRAGVRVLSTQPTETGETRAFCTLARVNPNSLPASP